ncbi:BcABA4 [Sodiomyces alkalinus F11]|uniref:BcABA4 n=1 Tax=Sodiomyces alkalinus (strain CBS 110278 / VKM F-3762 / F11) TaxID=1314773 RepID=A0A3N2PU36_SODAK|nr:BcABA4 [Sodiomyces alkalinus F11]ROT38010.1 BcABA4 [Sodiomyces alkalinus F11]
MTSPTQFADKVIALTGAASGIGQTTAYVLASRGARLSLADVQQEGLEATKAAIEKAHPAAEVMLSVVDVRDHAAVDKWVSETVSRFGRLDGAANLAGVIPKSIGVAPLSEQDLGEWDFVTGVNLTGVMHCMRAQLRVIADGGSVVNASSVAGIAGRPRNAAYAASKHGVVGLTKSAAKEVGARQVRVNAVCPGRIETPMLASLGNTENDPGVALQRAGKPEEVAKLIAFLLSDESTYVSGTAITIDGGWYC